MSIYFRRPRTRNEKVLNERDIEFVRGRRRPSNLPDGWDDEIVDWLWKKSWKTRTRKRKSWMRGSLRNRWYFVQSILSMESSYEHDRMRAEWDDREFRPWTCHAYYDISKKDL